MRIIPNPSTPFCPSCHHPWPGPCRLFLDYSSGFLPGFPPVPTLASSPAILHTEIRAIKKKKKKTYSVEPLGIGRRH